MKIGAGVVGAVVGGAIGSAAWAAISHFGNVEIGWIASITGALAGIGFKLGYPRGGVVAGVLAALIGVAAIGGGKVAALVLAVQTAPVGFDVDTEQEAIVSYLAEDIVEEKRLAGETLDWPGRGRSLERGVRSAYPREVWSEATARWDAMPPTAQERYARHPMIPVLDEVLTSYVADDVVAQWEDEGREVAWPDGAYPGMEGRRSWFAPEVWAEAESRWDALPETEKEYRRGEFTDTSVPLGESVLIAVEYLPQTVGVFDALWVALGVAAAYKIAAGGDEEAGVLDAPGDDPAAGA